jgi:hypothetical protein
MDAIRLLIDCRMIDNPENFSKFCNVKVLEIARSSRKKPVDVAQADWYHPATTAVQFDRVNACQRSRL